MKRMIIIGIIILVIGIVSAGVIEYYGRVEQTISVNGLVFYIVPLDSLSMNEKPISSGTPTISNTNSRIWINDSLDIDFNNIPKVYFYVRAKVNVTPQNLTLIFGYNEYEICSTNITINTTYLYNYGPFSCSGSSVITSINKIYYGMKGDCDSCIYGVKHFTGDFYTRMEISAI